MRITIPRMLLHMVHLAAKEPTRYLMSCIQVTQRSNYMEAAATDGKQLLRVRWLPANWGFPTAESSILIAARWWRSALLGASLAKPARNQEVTAARRSCSNPHTAHRNLSSLRPSATRSLCRQGTANATVPDSSV